MMAEDAVIMVPDFPVQEGREACAAFVRDVLNGLLDHFHRRITYVSTEVRVIGDYAFDRGSFSFTVVPKTGGEASAARGKYLWLYSCSDTGSWKLARLIVSLDEENADERGERPRLRRILAAIGRWLVPSRRQGARV